MAQTLYASFADASLAEKAAGALLDYGVHAEDLSLVTPESDTTDDNERRDYVAHSATLEERRGSTSVMDSDVDDLNVTTGGPDYDTDRDDTDLAAKGGISTTTPGDAAAGAAKGAGIGLGLGALAALASIAVPGFGLVAGGGALATAIAGAAGATAVGAVSGGVYGYLKDQGIDDQPARDYAQDYANGSTILSVNVPSGDVDQATIESVLTKYGAGRVNTYGAWSA